MVSITVLAPALGPLFGATILQVAGWRWIFWVLAIWGFIVLTALFFNMPETNPAGRKQLIKIKRIVAQYKAILINSDYMRATLSFCFLFGAMIAWISAGPFLVITKFQRSAFEFGVLQVLIFGSYIFGTRLVKPLMKRYATVYLLKAGITVAFCGGLLSLLTWIYPQTLMLIIVALMLIAGGTGFSSPLLNRTAIEASAEPMGARMAMYSTLVSVFGIVGSMLISAIYNGTLVSLSAILVIFSAIAFVLKVARFR
jgi:MFS family permease